MLSRQETGKEWDCPPSQKYKSCQWYLSVHSISNWITPVKYNISRLREVLSLFIEGVALFLLTPLRVDSLASSLQRSAVWVPDCWLSLFSLIFLRYPHFHITQLAAVSTRISVESQLPFSFGTAQLSFGNRNSNRTVSSHSWYSDCGKSSIHLHLCWKVIYSD